jgi:hypothetical protein
MRLGGLMSAKRCVFESLLFAKSALYERSLDDSSCENPQSERGCVSGAMGKGGEQTRTALGSSKAIIAGPAGAKRHPYLGKLTLDEVLHPPSSCVHSRGLTSHASPALGTQGCCCCS